MLLPVLCFLLIMMFLFRGERMPAWTAAIAWIVAMLPINLNLIQYRTLVDYNYGFSLALIGYIGCFYAGLAAYRLIAGPVQSTTDVFADERAWIDLERVRPYARFSLVLGLVGTLAVIGDFLSKGGIGGDLATLRDTIVYQSQASLLSRVASVMTWACLYSFCFALVFRRLLARQEFLIYLAPVAGFFMTSVASAGRQAAFQLFVIVILTQIVNRVRSAGSDRSGRALMLGMGGAMAFYMGYIAVARNDRTISDVKAEALFRLFDAYMLPGVEAVLDWIGISFKSAVVEGLIYFSSSISLFERFLTLSWPSPFFGAATLPFVARQLQGITGIDPLDVLEAKFYGMSSTGVIPVGWTGTVSSYIMDFGIIGAHVVMVIQGFTTALAWRRVREGGGFHITAIAILALLSAVYLPLLPAVTDTNILLMLIFCSIAQAIIRQSRMPARLTHLSTTALRDQR